MAITADKLVPETRRLHQTLRMRDLVPLSVSSVGPLFSVAATGGVMAADAGWWSLPAIALLAVPFVISAFIFRMLNRLFPHAGASYHWSARIVSRTAGRYQAWILILAYFFSIPPIAIPASAYTLALIAPHYDAPPIVQLGLALFWIVFAAVPLLLGARPMARVTQAFFAFEVLALTSFTVVGLIEMPHLSTPVHFGAPPIGGILVVAVIAATILDGWEVDSYAAEECRRPRSDPGKGGIIGVFGALLFYAILYPLMLLETPIGHLANAVDPLAVWSQRLVPGAPWLMLVPILCSSAGAMWLVAYTLIRAMYAMGRENLISPAFAKLNRQRVPHVATIAVFGAAALVVAFQLFVSSLAAFFSLVLSAAGFFLIAEFFLDSVTAVVFLSVGHRKIPGVQRLRPAAHRLLLAGSALSTLILGALLVAFFFYGPIGIGHGIDQIIAVLLGIGVAFTWWTRRRSTGLVAFAGREVTDEA
ncbi:MAG TPA: APC family permease [Streptosporangiaceae bacterium]|jgi:amino acid transporter